MSLSLSRDLAQLTREISTQSMALWRVWVRTSLFR